MNAETMSPETDLIIRILADLNRGVVMRAESEGSATIFRNDSGIHLSGVDSCIPLNSDPSSEDPFRRMPDYLLVCEIARGLRNEVGRHPSVAHSAETTKLLAEAESRGIKL